MKNTDIETRIAKIMGMSIDADAKLKRLDTLYWRSAYGSDQLAVRAAMMEFPAYRARQSNALQAFRAAIAAQEGTEIKETTLEDAVALGELYFRQYGGMDAPQSFIIDTFETLATDGLLGVTFYEKVIQFPSLGNEMMAILGYRICKNIIDTHGLIKGLETRERKTV